MFSIKNDNLFIREKNIISMVFFSYENNNLKY